MRVVIMTLDHLKVLPLTDLPETPYGGDVGCDLDLTVKGGPVPPGWTFDWVGRYVRTVLEDQYVRASARQSAGGGVHLLLHRVGERLTVRSAFELRALMRDDPKRVRLDMQRYLQSGDTLWVRGVLFDQKGPRSAMPWRPLEIPPATPKEPA